jgi:RNA 2',3'-cyclic 3'-phosphodiesterase
MPARLKLFVSLEPPWSWVSSLEWTQQYLQDRGFEDLEWIGRERLHMTLTPLGEVDRRCVDDIIVAMTRAAGDCEPFELQAGTLDLFGQPGKPTVLWAGVRGEMDQLDRLWRALQINVGALGCSSARSRFKPHITLAYVPRDLRESLASHLRYAVTHTTLPASDPHIVRRIYLIHSTSESGRLYHKQLASAAVGIEEHGC